MKFSLPFGKKKGAQTKAAAAPAASRTPAIKRVSTLSAQGVSEPEIIRELRSEGYSPMEVDNAMKQALRTAVEQPAPGMGAAPPQAPPAPVPGALEPAPPVPPTEADRRRIFPEDNLPPLPGAPKPPFAMEEMERLQRTGQEALPELPELGEPGGSLEGALPPEEEPGVPAIGGGMSPLSGRRPRPMEAAALGGRKELEELAEAIIDEKADMFRKEVDGVSDEIKKVESKIHLLEERFHRLEGKKKSEIDEIKRYITGYKESITEISSRMESVERAMKDSLTPMMQTLRALSDTVRDMKRK